MGWAEQEWATAALGDERLNRRLVKVAQQLAAKPSESIPTACNRDLTFTPVRFGGVRLNQKLEALDQLRPPVSTSRRRNLWFGERRMALD